jgi:predicted metal-dependent HD superfamily phosphohydrolase
LYNEKLGGTQYWVLGAALAVSLISCIGLYLIRNWPVRESFLVEKLSSAVFLVASGTVGYTLFFYFYSPSFNVVFLGCMVFVYALPFVVESMLARPLAEPELFGVSGQAGTQVHAHYSALLDDSWCRCWAGIGATGDGLELKGTLICAWNEPQRKYHTEQHLRECLELFEEFQHLAVRPHEVELAIWFHDAVYDVKGKNNELRSAEWAYAALTSAGINQESCQRVYDLIMATEHSAMDSLDTTDKKLLVDIDLAILGSSSLRFAEYERQVRDEYSFVPGFIFRKKRRQILQGFLERRPLYQTPDLQLRFELQARRNLSR